MRPNVLHGDFDAAERKLGFLLLIFLSLSFAFIAHVLKIVECGLVTDAEGGNNRWWRYTCSTLLCLKALKRGIWLPAGA